METASSGSSTMSIRKSPPPSGPGYALTKRARVDSEEVEDGTMTITVASSGEGQRKNALIRSVKRTSGLEAPIVALSGAHGVSSPSTFLLRGPYTAEGFVSVS